MSGSTSGLFSGRGKSEFDVPPALTGRPLLAEAWGRRLGRSFDVEGERTVGNMVRREYIGGSGWGAGRSHIVIPPHYSRLAITNGVHKPKRWNIFIGELSAAPAIEAENAGTNSRVYAHHGDETEAKVDFAGHGAVWFYSFQWENGRELISHTDTFRGAITIPGPGLVAVGAAHLGEPGWGTLPPWKMTLRTA
ncbi:hypothetical protein [Streptomyces sp. KL118A]|uniref:hypothetical protein n=1 Tax=Streptomyces sp. KL118A TaxID=3045153 RepID=UPI00278C5008|nr:hypothetical protein [Streptomyces sp. KL118A]